MQDDKIASLMAPFKSAYENKANDQLEGMVGTLRVNAARLVSPEAYWVFTGDDFDLKISDREHPSYLVIANDPEKEQVIGSLNALVLNRLITRVNSKGNIPVSIIVDELPTLYVAVLQDSSAPGDLSTDTGIALANMTLAAWDKGVGSCIMGAINKPALTALLGIEEPQKLAFMVAFGYPTHKASIVPMTEQTGVKYYLDENRDYCVPKRSAEEIARSV